AASGGRRMLHVGVVQHVCGAGLPAAHNARRCRCTTILKTPVAVKSMAPFSVGDTDVVVDVVVDEQGRMMDYAIVAGASVLANEQTRRRLENALVFSNFTPATSFGQPMMSKMRLWFHSSRIDVRG